MKKKIKKQGFRLALISVLVYEAMGAAQAANQNAEEWTCTASAEGAGWHCESQTATGPSNQGYQAISVSEGAVAVTDRLVTRTQAKKVEDLGWIYTGDCSRNLCGGYYEALILPIAAPGVSGGDIPIRITANESSFSQEGLSQLDGDVIISRAGSQLNADTVYLDRDPKTQEFTTADAYGNVVVRQPGFLAVASHAHTNLDDNTGYMENVLYRMPRLSKYSKMQLASTPIPTNPDNPEFVKIYGTTGWGRADSVVQRKDGIITLKNGTYTTCTPDTRIWELTASTLDLDNKKGIGTAYNAKLNYKGVPVFYFPYYRFPLNDKRATGFLMPQAGYSSDSGYELSVPFYWNIAPNYDATITPTYYSERGLQLNGLFRWLTDKNTGTFSAGIIPDDQKFSDFQSDAKTEYAGNPNLSDLEDASTTRGYFSLENHTQFNPNWSANIDYNYVSDDYYLEDFSTSPQEADENQLLRQADVAYRDAHVYFLTRLQGYQTLEPVDQPGVTTQYERLPEIDLNFDYPDSLPYGLAFSQQNQFVYFNHDDDINSDTGQEFVTGTRFNTQPALSLPTVRPQGFITPTVQLQGTFYNLDNPNNAFDVVDGRAIPTDSTNPNNPNIILPVFDIDMGLYFDREAQLFGNKYRQTLEPRLMYLYVPYQNQDDIPLFDTSLPMFTYDSLWRTNRFSGVDRLGDANQVSLGVTSRFIDPETGVEKIRGSIGQIVYFQDREVTLCGDQGCAGTDNLLGEQNQAPNDSTLSPVAGELAYRISDDWSFRSGGAYTYDNGHLNNAYAGFQYKPDERRIINLSYRYIRGGDVNAVNSGDAPSNNSSTNDYNRPDVSIVWPITDQWSFMGQYSYNISHSYEQAYFYGLQYSNCCWSLRFIQSRYEDGIDNDNNVEYTKDIYIEFSLHGLGSLASSSAGTLLTESIPGYVDRFGQPI